MFNKKLRSIWQTSNSLLCVGLDPDLKKLPPAVANEKYPVFEFNRALIDATADLVCAYKPQIAYYSAQGAENELAMTIEYLRVHYPDIVIILDAKRNDIGNTSKMYAAEAFDRFQVDAVTVSPYLGGDSLEPFFRRTDKGVIVLCRTSNTGSGDLQNLQCGNKKLFEVVAEKAANDWNSNHNVSLVVGGTHPQELRDVRKIVGDMPFLVPGLGEQGGQISAIIANGLDSMGTGLMISSSRAINYASSGSDFAQAARNLAISYRDEINHHRLKC